VATQWLGSTTSFDRLWHASGAQNFRIQSDDRPDQTRAPVDQNGYGQGLMC